MGNLMLNHLQMTCFWVVILYAAERLPRCDRLKVNPLHKGLKKKKKEKKRKQQPKKKKPSKTFKNLCPHNPFFILKK